MMGRLEVITGCMFSGKTETLLREIRRAKIAGKKVRVFKHSSDSRYAEAEISSHNENMVEAIPVTSPEGLHARVRPQDEVIFIDEVQFFNKDSICVVINDLVDQGKRVVAVGTDTDFRGMPFGAMHYLLCWADQITKLTAICVKCGEEAIRNQRLVEGKPAKWSDPIVLVGASESYEARCRNCFEVTYE